MNNVSNIKECYGCGVCATVCAHKVISIKLNVYGFYTPVIEDISKCTNCGLCVDVCAYSHNDLSLRDPDIKSYGGWSRDEAVRRKCSSGGVGFELGRTALEEGFKVCGVRYNAELGRAEHYIASTVEELIPSIGSKYIQSYTVDGFSTIDRNQKYLVTGTPCQIDSFRRYLQRFKKEENFVLMDFFCHGVPSMLMWQKYVKWAEAQVGKLTYVSWRNKFTGWHDSWAMAIDGEEKGEPVNWHDSYNLLIREKKTFLNSRLTQGDMFYQLFLSNTCLGKACYKHCKYKYNCSAADIRIGDAWGKHYEHDDKGVSTAVTFTKKGDEFPMRSNCQLEPQPFDVIAEGQMKYAPTFGFASRAIYKCIKNRSMSIEDIYSRLPKYKKIERLLNAISNPKKTLKSIYKRFIK